MPRPRKANVDRYPNGKSKGERDGVHPEVLAVRLRQLGADGLVAPKDGADRWAASQVAGFTLGRLLMRHRQDRTDPQSISPEQFNAGEEFSRLCWRHASIMGFKLGIVTPSFIMVPGTTGNSAEPDEEIILEVRNKWRNCCNQLADICHIHGNRVFKIVYGVSIENWPMGTLYPDDFGKLRIGLNAVGKALDLKCKSV